MSGKVTLRVVSAVMAAMAATGCANQNKQRITLLEESNVRLTERLNLTAGELEAAKYDQEDLDRRLQGALEDGRNLREQLAAQPTPQPTPKEPAPGWTTVPGGAMIAIEGNVLFSPGMVVLRKEARRTLDAVVSAIQGEYAQKDVLVLGHTDDQPIKKSGWLDNSQLSTERALAVVRYLRDHGVFPERLIAGGCGEYRPRVKSTSQADRAANRRVEIFAIEPLPRSGQP